jgi:hypothetical protein
MADPLPLANALAELIAVRGYARRQADADLQAAWEQATKGEWRGHTQATRVIKGVLQVTVKSAALLSELAAFQQAALTEAVQQQAPHLRIKSIKFRLK